MYSDNLQTATTIIEEDSTPSARGKFGSFVFNIAIKNVTVVFIFVTELL